MTWTLSVVVNFASGALFMIAALAVLRTAPRNRANLAFAAMAGGFGLRTVIFYVAIATAAVGGDVASVGNQTGFIEFMTRRATIRAAVSAATALYVLGLVLLVFWFPRPWRPAGQSLVLPLIVFLATFGVYAWDILALEAVQEGALWLSSYPIMLTLMALLAERHRADATASPDDRAALALASAAFGTFTGPVAAGFSVGDVPGLRPLGTAMLVVTVVLAGAWLRNMATPDRRDSRRARTVALYLLAVALVGLLWPPEPAGDWRYGAARLLMIAVLAYATVRHQLLGIDVKVRWGISKTTLAAVFIAVFFIASEAAQEFFGETLGSNYVGILAAGLLVFAIAPLSRFADRVADKAIPGVKPVGEMTRDERSAVYLDAARAAWRDGSLDRNERALLDQLQASLRLDRDEAMRLEQSAARADNDPPAEGARGAA